MSASLVAFKMLRVCALSITASLAVAGCLVDPRFPSDPSTQHETKDTQLVFVVDSDGATMTASASLSYGSDSVRLDGGDVLNATLGGAALPLLEVHHDDGTHDNYSYEASAAAPAPNATVTLAFVRGGGRTSAPSTQVALPPAFTLGAPPASVLAGHEFTLPSTDLKSVTGQVNVTLSGTCLESTVYENHEIVDADGAIEIYGTKVTLTRGVTECMVDVKVSLEKQGTVDPAFPSYSNAIARQTRTTSVRFTN